jgi:hypothetical protein
MRSKYVALVALLIVGSVAAPPALAAEQTMVTITVSVVDGAGDPVSGAELTASWDDGEAVETTRSNGQALIDVPEGSDVRIAVDHSDYVRNAPYRLTDAQGGDVTVEVAPEGSAVVRVTDGSSALADAQVTVSRDGETVANGTTNDNGAFKTGAIEQGQYDLRAVKPGYYAINRTLSISGSVFRTVSIEQGTATVRVRIVDDHFDSPRQLSAATVRIGSLATLNTSQDGRAAVGVPVNSDFEVRISKDGYRSATERLAVREDDRTVTYAVQRTPALTAAPANTRVVVGQTVRLEVRDEYDEPVSSAAILRDGERVATTDGQGVAHVAVESTGEHEFRAQLDGVESESVAVEGVDSGSEKRITAETSPANATATTSGVGPGFTGPLTVGALALASALGLLRRR